MYKLKRFFKYKTVALTLLALSIGMGHAAVDLTGSVGIERTADTASAAKSVALSDARRDLFNMVLSRYADPVVINDMSQELSGLEIENLIESTGIENEKTSTTSYSARITITFDRAATEKWLAANNVPNFMADADDSGDKITVFMEMNGGLSDWVALLSGLRAANVLDGLNLSVKTIFAPQVTLSISAAGRLDFVRAVRDMGWNVTDKDGILRISRR